MSRRSSRSSGCSRRPSACATSRRSSRPRPPPCSATPTRPDRAAPRVLRPGPRLAHGGRAPEALAAACGVKLPATAAFDHPTPAALAALLRRDLLRDEARAAADPRAELDRLEATLSSIHADEALRPILTQRLKALLARWSDVRDDPDDPDLASKLRAASDEELLDLLAPRLWKH